MTIKNQLTHYCQTLRKVKDQEHSLRLQIMIQNSAWHRKNLRQLARVRSEIRKYTTYDGTRVILSGFDSATIFGSYYDKSARRRKKGMWNMQGEFFGSDRGLNLEHHGWLAREENA